MMQRAMLAPMVWILVSLLDGKCFICAFSMSVDPKHFSGFPNDTGLDLIRIMAKVPCKEDSIFKDSTFRKAVSRYVRCYSQVSGLHFKCTAYKIYTDHYKACSAHYSLQ